MVLFCSIAVTAGGGVKPVKRRQQPTYSLGLWVTGVKREITVKCRESVRSKSSGCNLRVKLKSRRHMDVDTVVIWSVGSL